MTDDPAAPDPDERERLGPHDPDALRRVRSLRADPLRAEPGSHPRGRGACAQPGGTGARPVPAAPGAAPPARGGGGGGHRLADDTAPDDGRRPADGSRLPRDRRRGGRHPAARRGAHNNLLGEEATLQLARVTGNAMARLAETIVGVFRLQVELPRRAAGTAYVDVVKEYAELTQTLLPNFVVDARRGAPPPDRGRGRADVVHRPGAIRRDGAADRRVRRPGGVHDGDGVVVAARADRRPGRVRPAHLGDRRRAATVRSSRPSATRRCSSPSTPRTPAGSRST